MKREMLEASKETIKDVNDVKKVIAFGFFMALFPFVVIYVVAFGVAGLINYVVGEFTIFYTLPTGGLLTAPSFVIGGIIGGFVGFLAGFLAFIWECRLLDKLDFKK